MARNFIGCLGTKKKKQTQLGDEVYGFFHVCAFSDDYSIYITLSICVCLCVRLCIYVYIIHIQNDKLFYPICFKFTRNGVYNSLTSAI